MNNHTDNQNFKIRLGIDLDGVIYNFYDEMKPILVKDFDLDEEEIKPPTCWDFYSEWGISDEQYFSSLISSAVKDEVFCHGEIYPQALEGMNALRDLGFEVVIITARQVTNDPDILENIRRNTESWLDNNNVPYDELIIDNDKTRHNLNILVDDSLANIENFVMAGGAAYVFDRPWNRSNTFYARVQSWADCVLEMTRIQDKVNTALQELHSAGA